VSADRDLCSLSVPRTLPTASQYWQLAGYLDVKVSIEPLHGCPHESSYAVRSTLVNGLPPR